MTQFLKLNRAPVAVRYAPVVEYLEHDVEDVWVRLFNLVEEHDRVRMTANRFRKLAAFFISDVSRRRSDEARDCVLLHVLGHIYPDDVVLRVEERFGERASQLRLAYAGRAEGR